MHTTHKILVTGGEGQLAQALKHVRGDNDICIFVDKNELDITSAEALEEFFKEHRPDVVINTAAYTQVDASESYPETAFSVNDVAVKNLAGICESYNCKLIHISTDYVFDGTAHQPYRETDPTNPVTVYGKSKRAGEEAIQNSKLKSYAIVRTSWLYSPYGHNFYKTMLRLAHSKNELSIVNDQKGSPTNALHLAEALLLIAHTLKPENSGLYHYCNGGQTTWFGFAKAIFEKHNLSIEVKPVTSEEYATAAQRPAYSVLDSNKIKKTFSLNIPDWQTALNTL
ncbi:MAG: dTDP-4-dehydrorhamnose reductase [Flavobacteriaceae bacterium]